MQNRNSPSGNPELLIVPFGCSAFQAEGTPQTELFKSANDPSLAGVGIVDTSTAYLGTAVTISGRSQLRSITVRNRIAGTSTTIYYLERVSTDDLSVRISVPMNAAGNPGVEVDNTSTDPQHFVIPLAAGIGFEDGDLLVLTAAHGNITGPTNMDVQVALQQLPNKTVFDDQS